jgi:altronate dehydratase
MSFPNDQPQPGHADKETVMGKKIFLLILEVACGRKKTRSDRWGLFNSFAVVTPAPVT